MKNARKYLLLAGTALIFALGAHAQEHVDPSITSLLARHASIKERVTAISALLDAHNAVQCKYDTSNIHACDAYTAEADALNQKRAAIQQESDDLQAEADRYNAKFTPYVSTEFRFSVSFPGDGIPDFTQIDDAKAQTHDHRFERISARHSFIGQVQYITCEPDDYAHVNVTDQYLDGVFVGIVEGGKFKDVTSKHITFQDRPALWVSFTLPNGVWNVKGVVFVDKATAGLWSVLAYTQPGGNQAPVQPFLDSFKLIEKK
jgi:hypothetical protein